MPVMTNEDLNVAIVRLQERTDSMAADIHEIKEALVGSGTRPGLVERTTITEQRIIGTESRLTSLEAKGNEQGHVSWKVLTAVIALASTLATGLVQAIKHLG